MSKITVVALATLAAIAFTAKPAKKDAKTEAKVDTAKVVAVDTAKKADTAKVVAVDTAKKADAKKK